MHQKRDLIHNTQGLKEDGESDMTNSEFAHCWFTQEELERYQIMQTGNAFDTGFAGTGPGSLILFTKTNYTNPIPLYSPPICNETWRSY